MMFGFTASLRDPVLFFTIYHNPTDFPGHVVMRCHAVESGKASPRPAEIAGIYDDVEQARRDVPEGTYRFERCHGDDPKIVESWMM